MVLNHASLIKSDVQGHTAYGHCLCAVFARYGLSISMLRTTKNETPQVVNWKQCLLIRAQ